MINNGWTRKVKEQDDRIKELEKEVDELKMRYVPKIKSINGMIIKSRKRG